MSSSDRIRRWCSPTNILVVTRRCDDPARVLLTVRHAEASAARILLVQLCTDESDAASAGWGRRATPSWAAAFPNSNSRESHAGKIWAEIANRSFILNCIRIAEIPLLVKTFDIDRVMVVAERAVDQKSELPLEQQVAARVQVPVWVIGRGLPAHADPPARMHKVLVPVGPGPASSRSVAFACELARSQGASLTALHVYSAGKIVSIDERSPFSTGSWLPLSSSALAQPDCPIEVVIRQGDFADAVLEFNARHRHEVIVLRAACEGETKFPSQPDPVRRICSEIASEVVLFGSWLEGTSEEDSPIQVSSVQPPAAKAPVPIRREA
jgi:hypothetical protein